MDKVIAERGATMEVVLMGGQNETVKVNLLPLGKMPDFMAAIDDDMAMIQLCTGKSKHFAENVQFDSALDLVDLCQEVNFPNALRWSERRAARMEGLLPVAQKGLALQKRLTS